jgi:hypothetical protein
MALSQRVLSELANELEELRRRRTQIDNAIKGLKSVLAAERLSESKPGDADAGGMRVRTPRLGGAGRLVSLRTRILEIIGAAPQADRALVLEQLRQEGFQVSGATSLPIRVSHELSRLRRLGVLRKDRGGILTVVGKTRELAPAPRKEGGFAAVS